MPLADLLEAGVRPLHVPKDSGSIQIEEFPDDTIDIEEFPDPPDDRQRPLQTIFASLAARTIPFPPFMDPLHLPERMLQIPAPSQTLPVVGGILGFGLGKQPGAMVGGEAGLLMGRSLQRLKDEQAGRVSQEPPLSLRQTASDVAFLGATSAGSYLPEVATALKAIPMARMASTALGGGVGEFLSQMVLGKKTDLGQAVETGVLTGATSGLLSKAIEVALGIPEFLRANRARLKFKLGTTGASKDVSRALEREEFVSHVQHDVERTIATSGEGISERMADPSLKIKVAPVTASLEQLGAENPGLHKAILRAADDVGERTLVTKYFPQLTDPPLREIGGMPVRAVTGTGRTVPTQSVPASITQKILAQAGAHGSSPGAPETMTGEEAQRLKAVFREGFKDALNRKRPMDYTQRSLLHLYNDLKGSILQSDPSLEKEFDFHTQLSSRFRQIESKLRDIDKLEAALEQHFGGSGSQAAFKALLSPEVYQQALDFARGHNIGVFQTGVLSRMLRYAAMVPLYLGLSEFRSRVRHSMR